MSNVFKDAPIVKVVMLKGADGNGAKLSEIQNDMTFLTKEQIITLVTNIIDTGEVGNIDTGFVTKLVEQNKNKALQFWIGTQAEYNALTVKNANTFYIITDDTFKSDVETAIEEINARIDAIEIPDIEAELTQLQTNMNALAESTAQEIASFEAETNENLAALETNFKNSRPVYEIGDTDTISMHTAGYWAASGSTVRQNIRFAIPLRRFLGSDKTVTITDATITIWYFSASGVTSSFVRTGEQSKITVTNNGLFLDARYLHDSSTDGSAFSNKVAPTVGVSLDVTFTVTAQ